MKKNLIYVIIIFCLLIGISTILLFKKNNENNITYNSHSSFSFSNYVDKIKNIFTVKDEPTTTVIDEEETTITNNTTSKKTTTTKKTNNSSSISSKTTTTTEILTTKTTTRTSTKTTTTTKKVVRSDVYLFDMVDESVESGDIDHTTGAVSDNSRRLRTKNVYKLKYNTYDITITNGYALNIYEYDSSYKFIKVNTFTSNGTYTKSNNAVYFKVVMNATSRDVEKTLSLGQWNKKLTSGVVGKITYGDFNYINSQNKSLSISYTNTYTISELQNSLLNEDITLPNKLWNTSIKNKKYTLDSDKFKFDSRKTYYISPNGNDDNSGLSAQYPIKSLSKLSGLNNINILLECGSVYRVEKGFTVGSNVTIASYGKGDRPVLNYYRSLNVKFTKVSGESNLYVADLKSLTDIYNGQKNKGDCNIGQLKINGVVNWKRKVYDSSSSFTNSMLTTNKDNWSWVVEVENAKLYIYTTSNPNNVSIEYAPPITALSAKGSSNIIIQGIEIIGAGMHAINFTNTKNVDINNCSFKYIGGSVLTSAGTRYGNAVQLWDSQNNVVVSNNIAMWIFDTCYTNQGSSSTITIKNVRFTNNIGIRSQWGLETWGSGSNTFTNLEYDHNIMYMMGDITNPNTKMQVSGSGHLYGEVESSDYITYRYGYTYHQGANLAMWFASGGVLPSIHDNIFWGTNRFLVIGTWNTDTVDISTLKNNLFYEDYYLSYNTGAALYKFKTTSNKYYTKLSSITSNTTNTESLHKRGTYTPTAEKQKLSNLLNNVLT